MITLSIGLTRNKDISIVDIEFEEAVIYITVYGHD